MKKRTKDTITIVIPAYNEATVIGTILDKIPKELVLNKKEYLVETIVINDGSTDNTSGVVSTRKHIHLINHILNSGAGAATRTGLNYSKKLGAKYTITMDADGQHAVDDVIKLANEISKDKVDFIIGSRLVDTKGMPWYRVLGNKGLSFITYLVFGVFVRDSQSGLRAYTQDALEKISFHSNHYAFCSEIIWSAHRQKLKIREIPITAIYSDYSLSKGQSNWGAVEIIRQILKRRFLSIFHG